MPLQPVSSTSFLVTAIIFGAPHQHMAGWNSLRLRLSMARHPQRSGSGRFDDRPCHYEFSPRRLGDVEAVTGNFSEVLAERTHVVRAAISSSAVRGVHEDEHLAGRPTQNPPA